MLRILSGPEGRLQYLQKISSISISALLGGATNQAKIDASGSGGGASLPLPSGDTSYIQREATATITASMNFVSSTTFSSATVMGTPNGVGFSVLTGTSAFEGITASTITMNRDGTINIATRTVGPTLRFNRSNTGIGSLGPPSFDTLDFYVSGSVQGNIANGQWSISSTGAKLLIPNGSASLPSLSFTNCTACGLFLAGGNKDTGIAANGAERQRWFSGGGTVIQSSAAAGMLIAGSSITAGDVITSTLGFIGGGATFTALAVNGSVVLTGTNTITGQSVFGASVTFNGPLVTNSSVSIQNISSATLTNVVLQEVSTNRYYLTLATTAVPGTMYKVAITSNGVITSSGIAPALSACGTSPTVVGNDRRMVLTEGATGNGCTITFAVPFFNAPTCFVDNRTMSLVNALSYAVTNTALTITQTASGGGVYDVWCDGLGE